MSIYLELNIHLRCASRGVVCYLVIILIVVGVVVVVLVIMICACMRFSMSVGI